MKRCLSLAVVVGSMFFFVELVPANEPARHWQVLHQQTPQMPAQRTVPHHVDYHDIRWNPHRPPTRYEAQLRRYQQLYPKFYYGFHGSYLYRAGVPTGDIGIRDMPW